MRPIGIVIALLVALAAPAQAQFGKSVSVAAGTLEDKALSEIYAANDPAQKIALLDKFAAQFGDDPDMALLAGELYVGAYAAQKNYGKAFEHGNKVLALDPDNLAAAVDLVRIAQEASDAAREFDYGERVGAILARFRARPAPAGASAEEWERKKSDAVAGVKEQVDYVQRALFNGAYGIPEPRRRAALLERFVAAFPDSPYTENAGALAAAAYQQAQDYPKMVEFAQKVLERDPNNISMHLLLADYWSERGEQLGRAEASAKKALGLLAEAKKPEQISDQQWQEQVALQKGIAYSALGQVYVNQDRNAQAVDAFKQARPLLKTNPFYYGRNLYRLGFTLAKMKRLPEARAVLTEAVSVNSPYKARAQETLDKIGGSTRPARKRP